MAQTVDKEVAALIDALNEVIEGDPSVKKGATSRTSSSAEIQMYIDAEKLFDRWPNDLSAIKAMLKRVISGSAVKPARAAKLVLSKLQPVVANAKKRAAGKARPDAGSYD